MRKLTGLFFVTLAAWFAVSQTGIASNHREAPITALDHKADITDLYAFKSYGGANADTHVTLILGVDPLLDPQTARTGSLRPGHPLRAQGRQ